MKTENSTKKAGGEKILIGLYIGLFCFLLLIGFLCFFAANWYISAFGRTGFDSIIFTLTSGLSGAQSGLIEDFLLKGALPALLCAAATGFLLFFPWKKVLTVPFFRKKRLQLFPVKRIAAGSISLVLSLGLIVHAAFQSQLVDYAVAKFQFSNLYEDLYTDPSAVNITFPEEKRNLVYIILESMETSYLSYDQGGAMEESLIPELYQLAQNNTNFSHNNDIGGFRQVPGASWTIGAMVAQTSGIPLKVPSGITDWQNGYGKDGVFLPGVTSLSDILAANGYNQALMVGSDANFGGRKTYYQTHGTQTVYDIYTARQEGIVPPGYFVWWGMEDLHLFDYAKEKLTEMAAQEEPFAFTMLTVDTHHIGGYICEKCGSNYEESYENAIACSSKQVAEFVSWLQQQPFYENTTVVVTGDHQSMDGGYFQRNVAENYPRHIYNCFLNSAVSTENVKNRQFCALDMFPTSLAALGCTIEGDRLGLGTNLFSDQKTYIELAGYQVIFDELNKSTDFYQRFYEAKP